MHTTKSSNVEIPAVFFAVLAVFLSCCSGNLEPLEGRCKGIDCSGHGRCEVEEGNPVCRCDEGYRADGLDCVEDCSGDDLTCRCSGDNDCHDGDACTSDRCDEGACQNTPLADGTACEDGAYCTIGETCTAGVCGSGTPVDCDDDASCTFDFCDEENDVCEHIPDDSECYHMCPNDDPCSHCICAPELLGQYPPCRTCLWIGCVETILGCYDYCDDENSCTMDSCDLPCECSHWIMSDGTPCDDGAYCTVGDACSDGACVGGGERDCSDGNPCTENRCDEDNALCANDVLQDGTECEDGHYCTVGETCVEGACAGGEPRDCSDDREWTDDVCNEEEDRCEHQLIEGWPCDDGYFCMVDEVVVNGECSGSSRDCSDENSCTVDSCDEENGTCVNTVMSDGTPCEDGAYCTIGETCTAGVCGGGTQVDCDDDFSCTLNFCDEDNDVCAYIPDDGDCGRWCDIGSLCSHCICAPELLGPYPYCLDCPIWTGCVETMIGCRYCDDENSCTTDICDELCECSNWDMPDGTLCNDGQFCSVGETCTCGICGGGVARDCSDGYECTEGACDDLADACMNMNVAEGTACGDQGVECLVDDACDGSGSCVDNGFSGAGTPCTDNTPDDCLLAHCDGSGTCDQAYDLIDCSGHGTCDDFSGTAVCICDDGWGGPDCSFDLVNIEWVAIPGGMFMMGSDSGEPDERPVHQVTMPAFEMIRTEVTVAQYQACVDDGVCTEPDQCGSYYNWGVAGREDHPVNCVDWFQAVDFCSWTGGRLPSEAEWEYAARGGGQDITYPWGDDSPSCTYAVMYEGGYGCGMDRTWSVCSKTAGNTAQGLCDMAGNVYEWVQDWYHSDYNGAPSDGSAWETPSSSFRVIRGGSFGGLAVSLRAANRYFEGPSSRYVDIGFHCAR